MSTHTLHNAQCRRLPTGRNAVSLLRGRQLRPSLVAQASPAATSGSFARQPNAPGSGTAPAKGPQNNRVDKSLVVPVPAGAPPSSLPLPPGPPFIMPFFGETNALLGDGALRFGLSRHAKYGPVFRTSFFGFNLYMVTAPELYKAIMAEDSKMLRFEMGGAFEKLIGDFNMKILTNKDDSRMPFRRSLLGSVTNDALAGYVPKMNEISVAAVQEMLALQGGWDITVEARKWGMQFANSLLAGLQTEGPEDEAALREDLGLFFEGLVTFDIDLPGTPLRKALDARQRLLARIQASVAKQIDAILAQEPAGAPGVKVRRNMMGYIIDFRRNEGMTLDTLGLSEMAMSVLQAGTDTSSGGFAGLLAVLAQRPDLWQKLQEEQRAVVAQHGADMTKSALDASKLLDACVREALRFTPPGSSQYRQVTQEFELAGRYRIPAGSWLVFNALTAQALEADFGWEARAQAAVAAGQPLPIPECNDVELVARGFDPERWLADPAARPNLFTFGHGPHTCLGMGLFVQEAKVLVAHMVRSGNLELITKDFKWVEMPLIKPEAGVMMRLTPLAQPIA